MEDIKEIKADVKEIRKDVSEMRVVQAVQAQILAGQADSLKEHMKRTSQNERLIFIVLALVMLGGAERLGLLAKLAQVARYLL